MYLKVKKACDQSPKSNRIINTTRVTKGTMVIDPVSAIISLGKVVYTISVEVKKVCKFKRKCHKLAEKTVLLFGVLKNNQARLGELDTIAPLEMSFRNCLSFIIQCQGWNLGSVVLEVVFRQKYPKLMAEMDEWMKAYSMETVVCFKAS